MGLGKLDLGKTFASVGAAAVMALAPGESEAKGHHNHAVVGVESTTHDAMVHAGYFRELSGHFSLGLAGGVGADFNGSPVGGLEALAAYHKTIKGSVFGVIEGGGGVEMVKTPHGVHAKPVGKLTVLGGYTLSPSLGLYVGPNVLKTPDRTAVSISVGVAMGW